LSLTGEKEGHCRRRRSSDGRDGAVRNGEARDPARLLTHLDRDYKKLRRKLKRVISTGREFEDPKRLEELEEIKAKMEELESEL